jgi:thymidine phosphorylase
MMMPKTSSRAITSPAGTADTMETLAPVELATEDIRRVVEREGGCVVWGGAVNLSPADDILIRIERAIDLDSEGQMIASILSKKIAAARRILSLTYLSASPQRCAAPKLRRRYPQGSRASATRSG